MNDKSVAWAMDKVAAGFYAQGQREMRERIVAMLKARAIEYDKDARDYKDKGCDRQSRDCEICAATVRMCAHMVEMMQ